jgi:sialic acid synthase SpsE
MVAAIHITEKALGKISYKVTEHEAASRIFRRSLFVVKDMKAGDLFTEHNVRSIRPGHGLHPRYFAKIVGKEVTNSAAKGTPVSWDLICTR